MNKDKWMRHVITIPRCYRLISRIEKAKDWTKENKKSMTYTFEEMVQVYDVYRLKLANNKASTQLWHRGCKVS